MDTGKRLSRRIVICAIILAGFALYAGLVAGETLQKDKEDDYAAAITLGDTCKDAGDKKKALRHYKDAVEISPDYPEAHFLLGKLYFLMRDPDRSIFEFGEFKNRMKALPKMDIKTEKFYIGALQYISEVYFTLKMYEDAKKEIDEILRMDPKNQTAIYNTGIYYYYSERDRPKAYKCFKESIELGRGTHIAKEAEYAIEFMRNNPDPRIAPDFSFLDEGE